ncbi:SDR family NAD(P)-dependent oxidoreductase [Streptomyces sp. BI20]|uniref:SDR family NAD(P)-dependent oxidoreductase n=1 Tax=Streptomyces sp. BI20 TaxID=3403460 RepID=UPI003C77DA6A
MPTTPEPSSAPGRDLQDLTGRTALVTGAASGIGRAAALLLADAGAATHLLDRDADGLAETVRLVGKAGGRAVAHPADVTDREAVRAAVASARAETGRLDVVAAIAGIMHSSTVLDTRDEDLDRVWDVNFRGVLHVCREAGRVMREQGSGSVVTMASGAVDTAQESLLCYSVAKVAVVQLTRTLATELGPYGVRANVVAPGWIDTPMTARHGAEVRDRTAAAMTRLTPLKRVGEAADVARAVLWLASDASSFVTGQIIRPNGGIAMPW